MHPEKKDCQVVEDESELLHSQRGETSTELEQSVELEQPNFLWVGSAILYCRQFLEVVIRHISEISLNKIHTIVLPASN